jgi:predicted component of type VI protein secretion system
MKLSLEVAEGTHKGKVIPITLTQFLIGRDPQCNLRPASPMISKRHCALLIRGGKVLVRDFGSTNGTLVNDEPVTGEAELHDKDRLKVGPLLFTVGIEGAVPAEKKPVVKATAKPAAAAAADDDEAIAAMLLDMQEGSSPAPSSSELGSGEIPSGSTVLDMPAVAASEDTKQSGADKPSSDKPEPYKPKTAKPPSGNTSSAAKAILEKYTRRGRK